MTSYCFGAIFAFGGIASAVRSSDEAEEAAKLAAPLSRDFGARGCRTSLAVNKTACFGLASTMAQRDINGDRAVGYFVAAGVLSAVATASIWIWRTPGLSAWIPDWFSAAPTVGPKSGGVILQGTW